jgi:hypothetical protein
MMKKRFVFREAPGRMCHVTEGIQVKVFVAFWLFELDVPCRFGKAQPQFWGRRAAGIGLQANVGGTECHTRRDIGQPGCPASARGQALCHHGIFPAHIDWTEAIAPDN